MKCQTKEFNQFYQQVVIPICLRETRGEVHVLKNTANLGKKRSPNLHWKCIMLLVGDGISTWWASNNWKSIKSTKNVFMAWILIILLCLWQLSLMEGVINGTVKSAQGVPSSYGDMESHSSSYGLWLPSPMPYLPLSWQGKVNTHLFQVVSFQWFTNLLQWECFLVSGQHGWHSLFVIK